MTQTLRGVVFDLDDTLTDYGAVEARIWAATATGVAAALPGVDLDEAHGRFLRLREPLFEKILSGEWGVEDFRRGQLTEAVAPWGVLPEAVLVEHCAARDAAVGQTLAMAGALELLQTVRGAGLRVGVLTNGSEELLARKLDALGVEHLLDGVVSAVSLGVPKPQPGAYAAAADALGLPHDALAMVGDHLEWDVLAPLREGYAAGVWLDHGTGAHVPVDLPPTATVVGSLHHVPAALGLPQF